MRASRKQSKSKGERDKRKHSGDRDIGACFRFRFYLYDLCLGRRPRALGSTAPSLHLPSLCLPFSPETRGARLFSQNGQLLRPLAMEILDLLLVQQSTTNTQGGCWRTSLLLSWLAAALGVGSAVAFDAAPGRRAFFSLFSLYLHILLHFSGPTFVVSELQLTKNPQPRPQFPRMCPRHC